MVARFIVRKVEDLLHVQMTFSSENSYFGHTSKTTVCLSEVQYPPVRWLTATHSPQNIRFIHAEELRFQNTASWSFEALWIFCFESVVRSVYETAPQWWTIEISKHLWRNKASITEITWLWQFVFWNRPSLDIVE